MNDSFLKTLRKLNEERCTVFGHGVMDWEETDWACAVGGECGELLNLIKKRKRGDAVELADVAFEMADVIIYMDLLASRMGIDLEEAIRAKWNLVSKKRGIALNL